MSNENEPEPVCFTVDVSMHSLNGAHQSEEILVPRAEWDAMSVRERKECVDHALETLVSNEISQGFLFADPADDPFTGA